MRGLIFAGLAALSLAACSGDRSLHDMRSDTGGPDEFSVVPTRPLEVPTGATTLPEPTPGGSNLSDADPNAAAIAALGGRASAANAGGIPAADAALVTYVARYGTNPAIRQELAAEDAAFRRRKSGGGVLGLFRGGERYFAAYAAMALDAYAELIRFRNLGVQVPSAPPAP